MKELVDNITKARHWLLLIFPCFLIFGCSKENEPSLEGVKNYVSEQKIKAVKAIDPEESNVKAMRSRTAWIAFECSALAGVLDKPKDSKRLFNLGYDNGKIFLEDLKNKKITQEDMNQFVPTGFIWVTQGPTPDFILGRVYEGAMDNAFKEVYTSETILDEDLKKNIANKKYSEANCDLIGL